MPVLALQPGLLLLQDVFDLTCLLQNKFALSLEETVGGYRDLTLSVVFKDSRLCRLVTLVTIPDLALALPQKPRERARKHTHLAPLIPTSL